MDQPSMLVLAKDREDPFTDEALRFVAQHCVHARVLRGKVGDAVPQELADWHGDYLFSYLSPWIVPQSILDRAGCAAINFHPGPPEYPGSGCYNFAVYHQAAEYGVTCHHMARRVDTGRIIAVRRFPAFPSDSPFTLAKRAHAHVLTLFCDMVGLILEGQPLPQSAETWKAKAYTRARMLELFCVSPDMAADEVRRRTKAAEFPGHHGAYVEIAGQRFYHLPAEAS